MGTDTSRERYRRLTPREARVLVLMINGASTTDIADVLGVGRGTINGIRQSIRRKLAIPARADLPDFVSRLPGLGEHLRNVAEPIVVPRPTADRRSNLVLRAALRDLDAAAVRVAAKSRALTTLAESSSADDRERMLEEAELVASIAGELTEVHGRALALARGPAPLGLAG